MANQKALDTYLKLLRTACLERPFDGCVDASDVKDILRYCQMHGTGPLVYNELLKLPLQLSSQTSLQMKQTCMQNMLLQGQWEQLISKCFGALAEKGVYAVLMKGFAYARMYPLPYLRAWGDLDVWVGPEQYHQACGILRDTFPEAKHHDEEWDELKHYCFVFPNGMAIELHRVSMDFLHPKDQAYWNRLSPVQKEPFSPGGEGEDDTIDVAGIRVPVFEAKYDLLFCFMHSWEHFCGTGIPLKQVCDMALLVHHARCQIPDQAALDAYLEKHLRALGMWEVWQYYGYMACKALAIPCQEWPLLVHDDTALNRETKRYGERLYEQVMSEGQCRKKDYGEAENRYEARENARKMNVLKRKWITLTQRVDKARFMSYFAPRYARQILWQEIQKGIRRTIRREEMINY